MQTNNYKKYLNPSVVARLSNMELKAKLVVEGFMAGLHKSPYHGFSVEFAQHRQYMQGDDLKYLDWKINARTDRLYIKQFEEETNLKSYILLDISRSMDFKYETDSRFKKKSESLLKRIFPSSSNEQLDILTDNLKLKKLEYASYLAASLSYLMLLQRDAISLTTYDTEIRSYLPPRSTKTNLKLILKELSNIKSENRTGTAKCLNEIADKIKRRGMVIIISDLLDDPKEVINAMKHFRYNKNEVIIFQILDPVEMSFFDGTPVTLHDIETHEEIFSQPFAIKKSYQEAIKEFISNYRNECLRNKIDYQLISTNEPYDKSLLGYLNKRKKLM
jgi:uncharacterized protein (DUF58 family)